MSSILKTGNRDILAFGSALGAAFFWSFSFIWFKVAYLGYKPITVVLFRLAIAATLVAIIALATRKLRRPEKKDIKLFFLMAFFEPFIYFLGESYGLVFVSSTVAAVIVATIPLFSPIAAWYFYRERLRWINAAGLFLSFVGVSLVVLNGSFRFDASPVGVGLEFMAVFAAIGYTLVLKNLAGRYNTMTIIVYQNLIGVILFLPIWLVTDLQSFLNTPFHPEAFRAIIYLAVFASTLAFVFFTQSVRNMGITRANNFVNLIPVFVAILSFFILKETLGAQQIAGIMVVVAGLFLTQAKRKEKSYETNHLQDSGRTQKAFGE